MDYKVSDEFNESNKNHKKSNVSTNIPLLKIIIVLLMCSFCFVIPFLVDEVGQYIGEDTKLMLNLQSITEDLGSKCKGKA